MSDYIATIEFGRCLTGEVLWKYKVFNRQGIVVLDRWSIKYMLEGQGPHCSGVSSWLYFTEKDRQLWKDAVRSGNLDEQSDEDQLREGLTQLFAERRGVEIRLVPTVHLLRAREVVTC